MQRLANLWLPGLFQNWLNVVQVKLIVTTFFLMFQVEEMAAMETVILSQHGIGSSKKVQFQSFFCLIVLGGLESASCYGQPTGTCRKGDCKESPNPNLLLGGQYNLYFCLFFWEFHPNGCLLVLHPFCIKLNSNNHLTIGLGITQVPPNEEALYQALSSAPVFVCVDASQWQFYSGGVFPASSCTTSIDHCVELTGYSPNKDGYWILRNSWGTTWGLNGMTTNSHVFWSCTRLHLPSIRWQHLWYYKSCGLSKTLIGHEYTYYFRCHDAGFVFRHEAATSWQIPLAPLRYSIYHTWTWRTVNRSLFPLSSPSIILIAKEWFVRPHTSEWYWLWSRCG